MKKKSGTTNRNKDIEKQGQYPPITTILTLQHICTDVIGGYVTLFLKNSSE